MSASTTRSAAPHELAAFEAVAAAGGNGVKGALQFALQVEYRRAGDTAKADQQKTFLGLLSPAEVGAAARVYYRGSSRVRAEFAAGEDAYVALGKAEAEGKVRVLGGGTERLDLLAGLPALDAGEAGWKAAWASTPAIRAEFSAEANYMAFMRAAARGAIHVL